VTEKEALDALQFETGDWNEKTFQNSTSRTILLHLKEEVKELEEATDDELPHEVADCILLLLHLAYKKGFSARDAIREKFEICKTRKWGPPDANGVIRHVKEMP
jgi:NTP pyrophosphatase (non-canonical NTP hydrolase)